MGVGTGNIERKPYAVIDGYVDVLRYKRKREQITNEKQRYISGLGAS